MSSTSPTSPVVAWTATCATPGVTTSCPVDFLIPGLDGYHFVAWGGARGSVTVGYFQNQSKRQLNRMADQIIDSDPQSGEFHYSIIMLQHSTGSDIDEDVELLSYGGGPQVLLAAATSSLLVIFSLEAIIEGVLQADRVSVVGKQPSPGLSSQLLLPMHHCVTCSVPMTVPRTAKEQRSWARSEVRMEWTQQLDGILFSVDETLQMWQITTIAATNAESVAAGITAVYKQALQLAWTVNFTQVFHDLISPGVSATSPSASARSLSHEATAVSVWWPCFQRPPQTPSFLPITPKEEKLKHPCPIAALQWCPGVLAKDRLAAWNGANDTFHDAPQDHPALMTLTVDGTVRLWVEMLVVHQPSPSATASLDSYFAMALLIPGQENLGSSPNIMPTARWARRVGPLLNRMPHASVTTLVVPPTKVLWLVVAYQNQISVYALRGLSPVVVTNFPGAQVPGASSISTETKRPQYLLWGNYSWNCFPRTISAWVHAGEDFPHVTFFDHDVGAQPELDDASIRVKGITFATALKECSSSPLAMQQRLDVLHSWDATVPVHATDIACMSSHPKLPFIVTIDTSGHVILWSVDGELQSKAVYEEDKELSALLSFMVDGIDATAFCRIFLISRSTNELVIIVCDGNQFFLYYIPIQESDGIIIIMNTPPPPHHWIFPVRNDGANASLVSIHLSSEFLDGGHGEDGEDPSVLIVYDDGQTVLWCCSAGTKQARHVLLDGTVTSCCTVPSLSTLLIGTGTGELHAVGYDSTSGAKSSWRLWGFGVPLLAIVVDEFQDLGAVLCGTLGDDRGVYVFHLNRVLKQSAEGPVLPGNIWPLRLKGMDRREFTSNKFSNPVSLCWLHDTAIPTLAVGRLDGSVALYAPQQVDDLLNACAEQDVVLKWTPLVVSRTYGTSVFCTINSKFSSQSLIHGSDGCLYIAIGSRIIGLSHRSVVDSGWYSQRAGPLPQGHPAFIQAVLASGEVDVALDMLSSCFSNSAQPGLLPLSLYDSLVPRLDEQQNAVGIEIESILDTLGIQDNQHMNKYESSTVASANVDSGLLDLGAWGIAPPEALQESRIQELGSLGSVRNEKKKKERALPMIPAPSSYSNLPPTLSSLVQSLSPYAGLVLDDAGTFAVCLLAIAQANKDCLSVEKADEQRAARPNLGILPGLHPAVIFWSLVTTSPQVALLGRNDQNKSTWDGLKARGAGFWLRDISEMIKIAETLAKSEFAATRQPDDAALWYAALGKKGVLGGLYRTTGAMKQAEFLLRDFSQPRHQEAASKNAFVLLGQHRYKLAAAFFVLGRRFEDATGVCAVEMNDIQLALFLARLIDETVLSDKDSREGKGVGPTEKFIIEKFVMAEQARWVKASGFWMLGDMYGVIQALTSDETDLFDTNYVLLNYLDAIQLLPALAASFRQIVTPIKSDHLERMTHNIAEACRRCIKSLDAAGLHIFGLRYWSLLHHWFKDGLAEEASLLRSVAASLLVCCPAVPSECTAGNVDDCDILERCGLNVDPRNAASLPGRLATLRGIMMGPSRSISPDVNVVLERKETIIEGRPFGDLDGGGGGGGGDGMMKTHNENLGEFLQGPLGKGSIVVKVDADRLAGVVACPLISPDLLGRPVVVASHKHGLLECAVRLGTPSSSSTPAYARDNKSNRASNQEGEAPEAQQQGGGLFSRLLMQIFDQASWDRTFPSTLLDGDVVGAAVASAAYEETMLPHNVRSLALAAHPSRPLLLSGCETTGRVLLWQFGGPRLLASFTPMASKDLKSASQFDAGGLLFFSSQLSRSFSKSLVSRMSNWGGVRGLAFSPGTGDRFAAVGEGGVVATWRLAHATHATHATPSSSLDVDGAVCAEWWHHCLGKEGRAVTYVGGSSHVLAVGGKGGGDNRSDLSIWDTSAPPNNAACIASRSVKSTVTALTTLPGGWLLSYGDAKGSLYLSDIRMLGTEGRGNEVLWSVKASGSGGVTALCGLPAINMQAALVDVAAGATQGAGAYLVTGSQDGLVRVWSAASGALVQCLGAGSGTGMDTVTSLANTTPPLSPMSPTSPPSPIGQHRHAMFSGISGIWGQGTYPVVTGLATCEEGLVAAYSNGSVRLFPVGDERVGDDSARAVRRYRREYEA